MKFGYIYIRTNEYWDMHDAFKLGKTLNIIDREQTYITSEIKRGTYIMIFEIEISILNKTEKQLQHYFNKLNLHVKFNAGIEFYKKEIVKLIIPFFDKNNVKYKILSKNEIDGLIETIRIYDKNIVDDSSPSPTGPSVAHFLETRVNIPVTRRLAYVIRQHTCTTLVPNSSQE